MEKVIYFIIVICSITSCRTGLEIAQNEIDNSIMFEASAIEGIYLNHEMSNKFGTFWSRLEPFNDKLGKDKNSSFVIDVLNERELQFSLFVKEKVVESKIFKFKFKANQIIIQGNSRSIGVPLIYFHYHREVVRLSLNKTRDLIATFKGEVSGTIFIFGVGESIEEKRIFKSIQEKH